jgi:hypothetical protein
MNGEIFLRRRQMHPLDTRPGRLDDYRLTFNLPIGPGERGVANVEPDPGVHTWGVLYLLTSEECDRLDRTEGVHRGVYERISVSVLVDQHTVQCPAFTYRSSSTQPGRKPSARYLGLLIDGATDHGLPERYVRLLRCFDLAWDERSAPS